MAPIHGKNLTDWAGPPAQCKLDSCDELTRVVRTYKATNQRTFPQQVESPNKNNKPTASVTIKILTIAEVIKEKIRVSFELGIMEMLLYSGGSDLCRDSATEKVRFPGVSHLDL